MQMIQNYKQLEKVSTLYLRLKDLDAEIIALDKAAMAIAECGQDVSVSLYFKLQTPAKDTGPQTQEPQTPQILYENFLRAHPMYRIMHHYEDITPPHNQIAEVRYSQDVCDATALRILDCMLQQKNAQRQRIVDQIKQLTYEADH